MADAPVTLILGLGREAGEAVARRFNALGHAVIAADPDEEKIERARANLPEKVHLFHGDLHTRLGLRNCMSVAEEDYARLDNLVVIPALPAGDHLAELEIDRFDKAIAKATRGAALAMRLFAERIDALADEDGADPDMLGRGGSITFILSIASQLSQPGKFTQSVAQGAILAAMRAGAVELAGRDIRVNAISAVRPRADVTEPWLASRTPLGRAAQADELADAAAYLASAGAAIVTGETLVLDGGRSVLGGVIERGAP